MTETFRDLVRDEENLMTEEPEGEPARYYIDIAWYDQHDRSFRAVAQGRFCQSCLAKIGNVTEERVPTVDKKSNRVVYENREIRYGENPMAVIRQCCSKQRNYITPETPLLEAVFRVFLANGNQPATLERIREQLGDWISLRDRPHNYASELIERLIANDRRYGLRPFEMSPE
jgi:hypothetical protein